MMKIRRRMGNKEMKERYDIVVIGGGASGLAAAITAARRAAGATVAVFEKKERTG